MILALRRRRWARVGVDLPPPWTRWLVDELGRRITTDENGKRVRTDPPAEA